MYIDIILDLSGQQQINHVRIIRALRSLFLIDNYLMSGVRRYVCYCNYNIAHTTRVFITIVRNDSTYTVSQNFA